ncbi:MAG: hypothetical protein A2Y03_04815 [Omnitrophica WOR_2 bacterium GWF2_38_59]|nr:MAG: hypothetical protein A2Y03_04815 [Omnitrophica WOR_2 bacterium GWF2_38_59]OGX55480.1 MAG: hypothetical protein A2447_03260 [Omnitrophica WOR_2 bacterium RIFOXYC2_FULL_38_12]
MRGFILLILFMFIASVSNSSTIRMKSGDIIEGDVIERAEREIKVDNGTGIIISYYFDEIESIDGERPEKHSEGYQTIKQHYYCGVRTIINLKDGFKQGVQRSYYKNGNIYKEENYEKGKLNGLVQVFDVNGNLIEKNNFVNDRKEGLSFQYYENGTIKDEVNFKFGIETGLSKNYYKDGSLMVEENYVNNEVNITIFDRDGSKLGSFYTKDGKFYHENGKILNGLNIVKFSNGNNFIEEEFNDGVLNGSSIVYYESGNIRSSGNYKKDLPAGSFSYYNEEGRVEKEEFYDEKENIKIYEKSYYKSGKLKEEILHKEKQRIHKIYDENGEVIFENDR